MRVEPRRRIFEIAVGGKAGIRRKRIGQPFPDCAAPRDESVRCSELPLGFGRQSPSGPATIRFGFERIDMAYRAVRGQRQPAPEPALFPVARIALSPTPTYRVLKP